MRQRESVWSELREVVWLASLVWGLSVLAVAVAIVLALLMDAGSAPDDPPKAVAAHQNR